MSKHTPGPWTYDGQADECIKPNVCYTGDIGGFVHEDDGYLAAAAPELLSALKSTTDLLVALGMFELNPGAHSTVAELIKDNREVIAQAQRR